MTVTVSQNEIIWKILRIYIVTPSACDSISAIELRTRQNIWKFSKWNLGENLLRDFPEKNSLKCSSLDHKLIITR